MSLSVAQITDVKNMHIKLQEDAGHSYPVDVITELLVIYDVCKSLKLNVFQLKDVLGAVGYKAVSEYINAPAIVSVNREKVKRLLRS